MLDVLVISHELRACIKNLDLYSRVEQQQILERLAFDCFMRKGIVPPQVTALQKLAATTPINFKFNPYHDELGRFTFGPGDGGNGGDSDTNEINDPPIQPVYPIETLLAAFSGGTMLSAVRSLLGVVARGVTGDAIEKAAQSIEDYLGGSPDKAFQNDAGDTILIRGDKKIRFDINNFSPHDAPHFHIEQQTPDGEWVDAGDQHWYPFGGE